MWPKFPTQALKSFQRAIEQDLHEENYHASYVNALSYLDDKEWKAFPGIHRKFMDSLPDKQKTLTRGSELIDEMRECHETNEDSTSQKTKIRLHRGV